MIRRRLAMKKILVLSLLTAAATAPARAVDVKAGDWTVNVGGNVNAFYTLVNCNTGFDGGVALAGRALGCGGVPRSVTACCRAPW
jgi:hypothetical protein